MCTAGDEVQAEGRREAPRGQGLPEAGHVLKQHVPTGQNAGERQFKRVAHPDDDRADAVKHLPRRPGNLVYGQRVIVHLSS